MVRHWLHPCPVAFTLAPPKPSLSSPWTLAQTLSLDRDSAPHHERTCSEFTRRDHHDRSAEALNVDLPPPHTPSATRTQRFSATTVQALRGAQPEPGPPGVYRREAIGAAGSVAQLAVVIAPPALERAGILLTTLSATAPDPRSPPPPISTLHQSETSEV